MITGTFISLWASVQVWNIKRMSVINVSRVHCRVTRLCWSLNMPYWNLFPLMSFKRTTFPALSKNAQHVAIFLRQKAYVTPSWLLTDKPSLFVENWLVIPFKTLLWAIFVTLKHTNCGSWITMASWNAIVYCKQNRYSNINYFLLIEHLSVFLAWFYWWLIKVYVSWLLIPGDHICKCNVT
jgi:hypothetical protein